VNCTQGGGSTLPYSCAEQPTYAQNYFNGSYYFTPANKPYGPVQYAGYETSGYIYNAAACVGAVSNPFFCTIYNTDFYVADSITKDNWNYGSKADAGTFPMGAGSPIWKMLNLVDEQKKYDVSMTNYNSWTWAQADYVPVTTTSVINLNSYDSHYSASDLHVNIKPTTIGGHLFSTNYFTFGRDYGNNTEYFVDVNNWDSDPTVYGLAANTTQLALNFRGLGLPQRQFNHFSNLLSVITNGEATCLSKKSGYCALSQTCDKYPTLWEYSFKVQFNNVDDTETYWRIPLASFAANYEAEKGACAIFVEYLDPQYSDSKQIILGGMFFQSVYAQFSLDTNAQSVSLFKNVNALSSTYLGTKKSAQGNNAFVPRSAPLNPDTQTETNGLPTFKATVGGITDENAYYLLDFSSAKTVVWDQNCKTSGFGGYPAQSCELNPTFMSIGFDGSTLPAQTGSFSEASFGGF
jgi:hypothetical protein